MKNIITLILCLLFSASPLLVKAQTCHAGTVSALKDTVCQGLPVTLKVTGSSGNIQWQEATGDTFAIIAGASDSIYRTVPLIQTTYFRVVVSNGSCSDTTHPYRVYVPDPLEASFSYTSYDNTIVFNPDSSKGDIIRYRWIFGDGDTSNIPNIFHSYRTDSMVYACLTIYDVFECSYTFCRDVDFFDYPGQQCPPNFTYTYSGDTILFSTSGGLYSIFNWSFGDDSVSDDMSPVHVYDSSGTYLVCLFALSGDYCGGERCQEVYPGISGVKPVSANYQTLIIYPNPCSDCEIKGVQNPDELLVTDILGRVIPVSLIKSSNGYQLNLPGSQTGFFLIKNARTGEVAKFVKE